MNISSVGLEKYRVIIGILSLILFCIITILIHSELNLKDELCETFSRCPYDGSIIERNHHFVAYYKNPLFFEKNIVIAGSDQFISYNTSSPAEYVWGKVFGDVITEDMIERLSGLDTFMIEVPFGSDKTMQWGLDVCRYGEWFCKKERLHQSPNLKNDIGEYDACMIILVQDEGSEVVDILKEYNKNCYIIDVRNKSWDKLVLWFENS